MVYIIEEFLTSVISHSSWQQKFVSQRKSKADYLCLVVNALVGTVLVCVEILKYYVICVVPPLSSLGRHLFLSTSAKLKDNSYLV